MRGRPDIVQIVTDDSDDVCAREDRPPGAVFVIGEINCIDGHLDAADFLEAVKFEADIVLRRAELPGIDDVTHVLTAVGKAWTGVNADTAVLIADGRFAAEPRDVNLPPVRIVAARDNAIVISIHDRG